MKKLAHNCTADLYIAHCMPTLKAGILCYTAVSCPSDPLSSQLVLTPMGNLIKRSTCTRKISQPKACNCEIYGQLASSKCFCFKLHIIASFIYLCVTRLIISDKWKYHLDVQFEETCIFLPGHYRHRSLCRVCGWQFVSTGSPWKSGTCAVFI
jgi:hypothetical protein